MRLTVNRRYRPPLAPSATPRAVVTLIQDIGTQCGTEHLVFSYCAATRAILLTKPGEGEVLECNWRVMSWSRI